MKIYAAALFLFLAASLAGVTLLGLSALDQVSATETMRAILAAAENTDTGLSEAGRLAADQLVFGEREHQRWLFQVATFGFLSLAGLAIFAAVGYRKLVGPLRRHAGRLAAQPAELPFLGEFEELGQLVSAFNTAQTMLKDKERGEVARYVVHQMKNLWTPVRLAADTLAQTPTGKAAQEAVELLAAQSQKANRLLAQFQGLYTFPEPQPQALEWETVLRDWLKETGIPMVLQVEPSAASLAADPFLMSQSLENLLRNAWEAQGQSGPPVEIAVDGNGVSVMDRGCGFSGNGKPKGLGLGLSFVRRTAEAHGLSVEHQDRQGGGSVVRMVRRSPG